MPSITHSDLINLLADYKGARPVGLVTLTDAKATKACPFGLVLKLVRAVAFVGAHYARAVVREGTRQGADAGAFEAGALPWGTWLVPGKVIAHKGRFYLRTQSTPRQRDVPQARVLGYCNAQGTTLERETVRAWLPVARESVKQQSAGLGETVWVRSYAFDSIRSIRIAGHTYQLTQG